MSVVVPVRDGAGSLPVLLDSLVAQTLPPETFEVIIVDNASRDATAAIAAARGARVVSEPQPNRSRARNAGVRAARSDFLAFTDADCAPDPNWLSEMVSCRGLAPLLAGPVEVPLSQRAGALERFESSWRFDQASGVGSGWAATANLAVEREAFDAVDGFDVSYRHIGEDADFCLRATRAGFSLELCSAAVVRHEPEHHLAPALRRAFFHGYSSAQVLRRLGVGHIAWHHPRPLVSPSAARAWHNVHPTSPGRRRESLVLSALAMATYAARVGGSVWAGLSRVR